MVNLKGYRKVIIDDIEIRYKCSSHETTNVYHEASNTFWKVNADNSGQLNKMSIPSVIIPMIRESFVFMGIKKSNELRDEDYEWDKGYDWEKSNYGV